VVIAAFSRCRITPAASYVPETNRTKHTGLGTCRSWPGEARGGAATFRSPRHCPWRLKPRLQTAPSPPELVLSPVEGRAPAPHPCTMKMKPGARLDPFPCCHFRQRGKVRMEAHDRRLARVAYQRDVLSSRDTLDG
jgi:hypothetical protein